ncbi:hypothetical protein DSECCO2_608450 [anaerobic digester metagenome]
MQAGGGIRGVGGDGPGKKAHRVVELARPHGEAAEQVEDFPVLAAGLEQVAADGFGNGRPAVAQTQLRLAKARVAKFHQAHLARAVALGHIALEARAGVFLQAARAAQGGQRRALDLGSARFLETVERQRGAVAARVGHLFGRLAGQAHGEGAVHGHAQGFEAVDHVARLFEVQVLAHDVVHDPLVAALEADLHAEAAAFAHDPPGVPGDGVRPAHGRPGQPQARHDRADLEHVAVAEVEGVVVEIHALVAVAADQLGEHALQVVAGKLAHPAHARAIGVVVGHDRRPDAENAAERTTPAGEHLELGKNLSLGIGVPVLVGVQRVEIGVGRGVELRLGQDVVADEPACAAYDLDQPLFVFALDDGMQGMVGQELFAKRGDGPGHHHPGAGIFRGDVRDERGVVAPARRGGFDDDVVEFPVGQVLEKFVVVLAQGDGVAERDRDAGLPGQVGRGRTQEERIGNVVAEAVLAGPRAHRGSERPARAGAHAGQQSRAVDGVGVLDPPGRVRAQDFHRASLRGASCAIFPPPSPATRIGRGGRSRPADVPAQRRLDLFPGKSSIVKHIPLPCASPRNVPVAFARDKKSAS